MKSTREWDFTPFRRLTHCTEFSAMRTATSGTVTGSNKDSTNFNPGVGQEPSRMEGDQTRRGKFAKRSQILSVFCNGKVREQQNKTRKAQRVKKPQKSNQTLPTTRERRRPSRSIARHQSHGSAFGIAAKRPGVPTLKRSGSSCVRCGSI